jgi:uncharacterized protein YndB with AHSA1/START domain
MQTSRSTVIVHAPREIVWSAVTLPEYVRQWQYGSELTTDWTVGHSIRFSAEWQGERFEQWGTVEEFSAPHRLRYSLFAPRPGLEDRPENYFTMTYELFDVDDGTKVAFTHADPRAPDGVESDNENPILMALRDVAESLANSS